MATRVRDWAAYDFYDLLGVESGASGDEIARAFRAAAKRSHPDATDDPVAAEQFKDLAAAYTVLSDHRTRRDYDRVRAAVADPRVGPEPAEAATVVRRTHWTRRRAWAAVVGGLIVTLLGLAAAGFTWYIHDRDATDRAGLVAVTADRLADDNIAFVAADGRRIVVREPRRHGDPAGPGRTVVVRYDPENPTHVVPDSSTVARDVTLAIVAIKFLIGGPVFVVLGARHLHRASVSSA